ncbi:MAG: fused MFS/spermidine synthase, partial [Thermoanaerobaculia bacterium]
SHFVWTAQIAVTLVALAVGYFLGGKIADLSPRTAWVHGALAAAGVYLALMVLVIEPVALRCVELPLAFGSLLASTLLFLPPLVLLAMVGPFLLRLLAETLSGVGGSAGRLSAVSTLGSVAGTVLIAYVMIPLLPNSVTLLITAAVLMALGAVPFLAAGLRRGPGRAAAILVLAGAGLGSAGAWRDLHPRFQSFEEVHRSNSSFGVLQVLREKESGRLLFLNDLLTQNTYDPARKQSVSLFTYMLHGLARAYTPKIDDALCIGLGVGIVPMELASEGVRVDVVEINPRVIPLATRFFDLDPSRLTIALGDGRRFIHSVHKQYDTIVLDAFLGDSSPSHLLTREAFAAMRRLLRPEGTLVINVFSQFT